MKKMFIFALALFLLIMPSVTFAAVHVNGYYRKNGTYVQPYYRSSPDSSPYNNYSYPGNTNPYTGKTATGNADTYLSNYYGNSSGISSSTYDTTTMLPTYVAPIALPAKNVSYVVKLWVTNNPGVSCSQSTFLRAKERTECTSYVSNKNYYTWNVTTNEFDGTHYAYDKDTDSTNSCQDGYVLVYSSATGKVTGCKVGV